MCAALLECERVGGGHGQAGVESLQWFAHFSKVSAGTCLQTGTETFGAIGSSGGVKDGDGDGDGGAHASMRETGVP